MYNQHHHHFNGLNSTLILFHLSRSVLLLLYLFFPCPSSSILLLHLFPSSSLWNPLLLYHSTIVSNFFVSFCLLSLDSLLSFLYNLHLFVLLVKNTVTYFFNNFLHNLLTLTDHITSFFNIDFNFSKPLESGVHILWFRISQIRVNPSWIPTLLHLSRVRFPFFSLSYLVSLDWSTLVLFFTPTPILLWYSAARVCFTFIFIYYFCNQPTMEAGTGCQFQAG